MNEKIDLNDLWLEAQAEFAQIVQDFQQDLIEPQMTNAVAMRWATLPNEGKEMLKERLPKTYQQITRLVQPR